jgi:RNA recognition motif-containing protein
MGGGAPPAGSTGAGIPQEDPNRLQLRSDEKHGQILKKHMGSSARKMFVGGLAHETTTANLWEYFEQFGEMEDVDIKCDVYTGASRGFGFILFKVIDLFKS